MNREEMAALNKAISTQGKEFKRLKKEEGYLPIESQFQNFLDDEFIPKRRFQVDDFSYPELFIYDKHKDIDQNLDIPDLIGERINRYFGANTLSDLSQALHKVLGKESSHEGPLKIHSSYFKKILIIRGNKVLEMHDYMVGHISRGTGKARLSYVNSSYFSKIKEKVKEVEKSCIINYRNIPK